jgi:putative transcriptional regulator
MRRPLLHFAMLAAAIVTSLPLSAQSARPQDLAIGKLLVARKNAPDPAFAETVILLVRYEKDGTLGLMLNRRTKIPIARALDGISAASQRTESVYLGGPVEADTVFALLRANKMPEGPSHVAGKIYLVVAKPHLEKALGAATAASDLRVYLGYCGWDKEQLENEIKAGAWDIVGDNADAAFDPNPDSLWSRLIAREDRPIAHLQAPQFAFALASR